MYQDLRDLSDELTDLATRAYEGRFSNGGGLDPADEERLADLRSLDEQLHGGIRKYAENEPLLIENDRFEDYARELAEDLGIIDGRENAWPTNFIDWEAATNALRVDYTEVTFEGDKYLIRTI